MRHMFIIFVCLDDDVGHECVFDKNTLQQAAAKDSLCAFLLSGSSDVKLALGAEEYVREACKRGAKQIYRRRMVTLGKFILFSDILGKIQIFIYYNYFKNI